jgi:outer membrane protein assembly factor BamB
MKRLSVPLSIAGLLLAGCSGKPLDAGTTYVLASTAPPSTLATVTAQIDAITMDMANLYFTCEDGWVYSLSKSTSTLTKIAPAGPAASNGSVYTGGIAVDDANVYWTADATGQVDGQLLEAPKGGGSPVVLAMSQAIPVGVAVDDLNVYWVDQAGSPPLQDDAAGGIGEGMIQSLSKGGGATRMILANNLTTPNFLVLDGEGGVIWHDAAGIRRVPVEGGMSTTVATDSMASVSNLVVADGTAYWGTDDGPYAIESASTTGGGAVTLAANVAKPAAVAPFGGNVYWNDANGSSVGAVMSIPSTGGAPTPRAWPADPVGGTDDHQAAFLLLDAQAFYAVEYWTSPSLTVVVRALPHSVPPS